MPSAPENLAFRLDLPDEAATRALAGRLALLARPGDVVALSGPLGAGKTTFARAFVDALGARAGLPPEEVPSPTFTLVQTYDIPGAPVYHFDLFRIAAPDEALELGIEDAFAEGISLIEWPERLGGWLPDGRLTVSMEPGENEGARRAVVEPRGTWRERLEGSNLDG